MIYLIATNNLTEMNIINSKKEITSIEELGKIPDDFAGQLGGTDYFLDYVSGDLLGYRKVIIIIWVIIIIIA